MPRAGWAALVPVRIEHKVIDDELPSALEEGFEVLFAARPVEDIVLVNPHHWQPAPLGIDAVAVLGKLLFMRQKFLPLGEPLFP
jgi:hypothetical protein